MKSGAIYEKGRYWVAESRSGGLDIFRIEGCASVRCAQCGLSENPLAWCKLEIDRRIEKDSTP